MRGNRWDISYLREKGIGSEHIIMCKILHEKSRVPYNTGTIRIKPSLHSTKNPIRREIKKTVAQ